VSILLLGVYGASALRAQEEGRQISMGEAVDNALKQSRLTVAGGTPFHLKAHIAARGAARPEYSADVEEYWVTPDKWRRTVRSAAFSQTLIANGDKVSEKLTGDYYPFWLHNLVTALFDPLPMAEQLKRLHNRIEIPEDSAKSHSCLNMQSRAGIAPVENSLAFVFCFTGQKGLVQAVVTPAYRAQFSGYQPFKDKWVARAIAAELAPGLAIEARVTELTELARPGESLFAIEAATPAAELMKTGQMGEDSARVLALKTPAMAWPAVREGKTEGVLSLYISVDRAGRVREAWPVAGDNAELDAAAREQVLQWQYKPYMNNGPSQMEAVLTFAFRTRIENPVSVLQDAEARKLAIHPVEAVVAPGKARRGTRFTLRVSVDETGKVQSIQNPNNVPAALYSAGSAALKQWRFRPYIHQGKPDRFYADVSFQVR
jgi:Gram-negative bacterial TonB protein C-terminal